jgi:hypothetical protein
MRAAVHLVLTPVILLFGWAILAGALDAPWPVRFAGALGALAGGVAYGWKNRHR